MSFLTQPVPHDEGARFIAGKPAVTRRVFDQLAPDLQARAFVITGVEALDAVARVRELVAELPRGGDFRDLKDSILAEISPWLVTSTDPEEQAKQRAAANRRAELLLRMHGWQAYARTQHALHEAQADAFPYRQYLSSEDGRVRPSHAALNKKILPSDHPFWANHTPPWEFGCRCDCVALTAEEVDEIRAAEQGKPPEDRQVLPDAQLREIATQKRIVKPGGQGFLDLRTPRERDGSGYEWRPADDALTIDQILERYTPAEQQAFRDFAGNQTLEDGRSLLEWWQGGGPLPVPGLLPAVPAPAAGGAVAARTLADIGARLDALAADHATATSAVTAAKQANTQATIEYLADVADPARLARLEDTRRQLDAARQAADALVESARDAVAIPAAERGAVTITSKVGAPLAKHVRQGADLTARYTAAPLLPSIGVQALRGKRAYHRAGTIHVNRSTDLSVIMHEITHATEQQTPAVLRAAIDFLTRRAGGLPTVNLRRHTGFNYERHEVAWEDDWERRGGNIYSGKDYAGRATEVLTMGIERLHKDPIAFRRDDREYFEFVLTTLQAL